MTRDIGRDGATVARDNIGLFFSDGTGPETIEAILATGRDFFGAAQLIAVDAPAELALLLACAAYVAAGGKREGVTFSGKTIAPRRFGVIEGGKGDREK
jgi:hypothetical protein